MMQDVVGSSVNEGLLVRLKAPRLIAAREMPGNERVYRVEWL